MEFIQGLVNLHRQSKECAATVGNFDGVHLGHQLVLEKLKEKHGPLDAAIVFAPADIVTDTAIKAI